MRPNVWTGGEPQSESAQNGTAFIARINSAQKERCRMFQSDLDKIATYVETATPELRPKIKAAQVEGEEIKKNYQETEQYLNKLTGLYNQSTSALISLSGEIQALEKQKQSITVNLTKYKEILTQRENEDGQEIQAWCVTAQAQSQKLTTQLDALDDSLLSLKALHEKLKNTETSTTKSLQESFSGKGRFGQSPEKPIEEQLKDIHKQSFSARETTNTVTEIYACAARSFETIFDSIKNISSAIVKQLQSGQTLLDESNELLEKCPPKPQPKPSPSLP